MNATEPSPVLVLSADDLEDLRYACALADLSGQSVRVWWDDGLKVKVGRGVWSPPMGHPSPEDAE